MTKMDNLKRKELHRIRDSIQDRIRGTQKLLMDIDKVTTKLEDEVIDLLNEIGSRGDTLKELIDNYVKKKKTSLIEAHEENVENLNIYRDSLERKLDEHEASFAKINDLLDQEKKVAKPLVNVAKVYQMVIDSIDENKSLQVNVKLKRCELQSPVDLEVGHVKKLLGTLDDSEEDLYGIIYPVSYVSEFKTRNLEINTIATNTQKTFTNVFVCFDVQKELLVYNQQGKVSSRVGCDFKINDAIHTEDGKLFVTSPDGKAIRCLAQRKKNGEYKSSVLKTDSLFLHGLTACNRPGIYAVCGTDSPNYTEKKPSETVIIEFTSSGKEYKRVMVSMFAGKVYRIAQNIDDRYVLTFPKDGAILSVDGVGTIRNSFSTLDFQDCVPNTSRFKKEQTFWPSGVACDSVGHVIVSEWTNAVVMMLDRNLNMLRHIGKYHVFPNALSFDRKLNILFLGDKESVQLWKTSPK